MRRFGFPEIFFAPEGEGGAASSPSAPSTSAPAGTPSTSSEPSGASPSAASVTPSSTPGTPPPGPDGAGLPSTSESSAADPWNIDPLADIEDGLPEVQIPAVVETVPQTPADPKLVAATPPPAVVPPTTPATPVAPPQPGPQEARPPLTPSGPGELAAQLQEHTAVLEQHLAKEMFPLSKEDVEALDTDASAHVPKLLARVYMRSQTNMLNYIAKNIPAMIQQHLEVQKRNGANEDKFYASWPQLSKATHGDVVRSLASLYRKMNPDATMEQLVADVGPLAMLKAGVPLTGAQPAKNGQNGLPHVATPTAVRQPPASPFVPAVTGASGGIPQPSVIDPWSIDPNAQED